MPVYQYEAMDNTGAEVKDTIEAGSEAEAQQKIKEQGFFVTKISEKGRSGKKKETEKKKPAAGTRKKKGFSFGKVKAKHLCAFTRQLSTLQDAGLPILRSLKILEGQSKPGPLKNSLIGCRSTKCTNTPPSAAGCRKPMRARREPGRPVVSIRR